MGVCENCPMRNARTVGSRGPRDSKIVLVGEAPGRDEIREGVPFIGQSGKILDKALRACGIENGSSDGFFVTNAVRCIPSKQKLTEACKACHGLLDDELKEHPRDVLILLGGSAAKSVLNNYTLKITGQRGKALDTPYGIAVPTFHPAFILRQPGQYKTFLEDIRYALSIGSGGEVKSPGTPTFEVATEGTVRRMVHKLSKYPLLAADIETSERNPRQDRILCIGVSGKKNEVFIFPEHLMSHLSHLFRSGAKWIWHNGKFDTAFLNHYGFDTRIDYDTMLESYAIDEAGKHGLKPLAASILGAKDWGKVLKKWLDDDQPSFEDVPEDVLYDYLAQDVDNTFQLHGIFTEKLNEPENKGPKWAYEHVMIPAANFLRTVERNGAWIDVERVESLRLELLDTTDTYKSQMQTMVGMPDFNPGSWQQVLKILHRYGIRVQKTDKQTIEPYAKRNNFVRTLLAYRADKKQLGTYVEGVLKRMDENRRVHSTFNIHVAVNGRLSSKDPNMQNIPAGKKGKRIKRIFGAPRGRCIVELDYSQAELRCLAVLSGDQWLKQVYIDGRDLHTEVSIELYGDKYTSEERRLVKTLNFGIPYGRQAPAIAKAFGITVEQAQARIDAWFARMPEAHAYLMNCRAAVTKRGYVMSGFGRKRRFPMATYETLEELQNQASNHGISSTASDLTLISAMKMEKWLAEHDAFIFNLVHDSIMIECPIELAIEIARYCKSIMEMIPTKTLKTDVPFVADVKVGHHWGDAVKVDLEREDGPIDGSDANEPAYSIQGVLKMLWEFDEAGMVAA